MLLLIILLCPYSFLLFLSDRLSFFGYYFLITHLLYVLFFIRLLLISIKSRIHLRGLCYFASLVMSCDLGGGGECFCCFVKPRTGEREQLTTVA